MSRDVGAVVSDNMEWEEKEESVRESRVTYLQDYIIGSKTIRRRYGGCHHCISVENVEWKV